MSEPEEADLNAKELAHLGSISGRGQAMRTELVRKLVVKLPVPDSLPMSGQPCTQEMRETASSSTKRKRGQYIAKEGATGETMLADKYDADSGICSGCGDFAIVAKCACMITLCILKAEDDQSCIADPESIDISQFVCPKCISCNPDMSMYYTLNNYSCTLLTAMVPPPALLLFYLTWGVRNSAIEGITSAFGEVFGFHKRQLYVEHLPMTMTSWEEAEADGIRTRVLKFLKDHPKGRFLLIIHTHADKATGQLCNSWSDDGMTALFNTIEEVCDYYLGVDVINALKKHAGLRGLVLLSCGSAVFTEHILSVSSVVQSDLTNFVVSFSGNHVNPSFFVAYLRPALIKIFTGSGAPWDTFVNEFTIDAVTLSHTPAVYVDKDAHGQARGRQVVRSSPKDHPWGFVPTCCNPACPPLPGNVKGRASRNHQWGGYHGNFVLKCQACHFSCNIERPDWIRHVGADDGFNFWMPWPLTEQQRDRAMGRDQTWKLKAEEESGAGGGKAASGRMASIYAAVPGTVRRQDDNSGVPALQMTSRRVRKTRKKTQKSSAYRSLEPNA